MIIEEIIEDKDLKDQDLKRTENKGKLINKARGRRKYSC